jgi:hypothetical protein
MFREERTMGIELKTKEEIALMREADAWWQKRFRNWKKLYSRGSN